MNEKSWLVTVLAVPVMVLVFASVRFFEQAPMEPPCVILPNGRVLAVGVHCPIPTNAEIRTLEAGDEGLRPFDYASLSERMNGESSEFSLGIAVSGVARTVVLSLHDSPGHLRVARLASAAVGCAFLLALPLWVARGRHGAALRPLAVISAATATILIALHCGSDSIWLLRVAMIAAIVLPAGTAHLGLTFPKARVALLESGLVVRFAYGAALVLMLPMLLAFERDGRIWPHAFWLLCLLGAGSWMLVVASCGFAISESRVPLERARSHVLCWGALILPVLPTAVLLPPSPQPIDFVGTYWLSSTAAMSVPVALAISRYNLFSLGDDLRAAAGRFVFVALSTAVVCGFGVALVAWLEWQPSLLNAGFLAAGATATFAILEPVRSRFLSLVQGSHATSTTRREQVQQRFSEQVAELRDAAGVASLLTKSIDAVAPQRHAWIFMKVRDRMAPVATLQRSDSLLVPDADLAMKAMGEAACLQLLDLDGSEADSQQRLAEQGVLLMMRLEFQGTPLGIVLLGPPEGALAYSDREIECLRTMVRQASLALHNASLAEDLLSAEALAARATFATGLLHDMGKQVNWIRMISGRLPGRLHDGELARRDLQNVRRLSEELLQRVREFVTEPGDGERREAPIARLCERAVEAVGRLHRDARVEVSVAPDARAERVDPSLLQALVNLLDNALLASDAETPVSLCIEVEETKLLISITDRGAGLAHLGDEDPFRLGFTTRRDEGGSGTGLPYARAIVQAVRGELSLRDAPGGGARAEIRVPRGEEP